MAQQTAVEWLVEQYANENYGIDVYEQAKALEREQIIDAYYYGATDVEVIDDLADAKLYYDETYKK